MKSLHNLAWACALLALISLLGCKSSSKPRVAFVSNNPESFWTIAQAGAKKAEAEFDVELLFKMPDSGDASKQKEVIDTVLNQGVKAVAVSVIDPKNQSKYLDEIAGKVKLLTVDNDAPTTRRVAYIGTDNYQAGRAVGKLVREAMPDGGTVVIFVGQLEALNARQRRQGVIDELAGNEPPKDVNEFTPTPEGELKMGKYTLYKKTYLDQPEGARKAMENAVDALTVIPATENVCMVGLWAYNPPQCLAAVKDKVKDKDRLAKIKIVGFDEDAATLNGIKEGSVYATVVQDPYGFGYESVKLMAALARGETGVPKDKINYVPHRVIMKEAGDKDGLKRIAVDPFRDQLDERLGKKK